MRCVRHGRLMTCNGIAIADQRLCHVDYAVDHRLPLFSLAQLAIETCVINAQLFILGFQLITLTLFLISVRFLLLYGFRLRCYGALQVRDLFVSFLQLGHGAFETRSQRTAAQQRFSESRLLRRQAPYSVCLLGCRCAIVLTTVFTSMTVFGNVHRVTYIRIGLGDRLMMIAVDCT